MSIKKLILPILAVVLVLIYALTEISNNDEYIERRMFPEELKINKITYYGKDINFTVEYDNNTNQWMIKNPETWPANGEEINGLIDALKETNIITELGVVEDNNTYEITDKRYLLLNNGMTYKIYIGKRDPSYKMVYVKVNDDKKAKLVDAAFTNYLPSSLNQIKDKTVYSFDEKKLTSYKIKIGNKTFEIRADSGKYFIDNKSLEDNTSLALIESISTLTGNTFVNKKNLDNASLEGYIEYIVDNETKRFDIYKDKDGDYLIPTKKDSIFKIYNFSIESFLKKFEKT